MPLDPVLIKVCHDCRRLVGVRSLHWSKHTKGAKQDQAAMRIELLVNLRRRAMAATTFGRLERGGGSRAVFVVSAASHPEQPPAANGGDEEGSCDEEHGR